MILSLDNKCLHRVREVVERALAIVLRDVSEGMPSTLNEFLKIAVESLEHYDEPCIEPGPVVQSYASFLRSSFQKILQTSVDKAMSSLAKHIDELRSPAYALIAALLMDYITHINMLISSLESMITSYCISHLVGEDHVLQALSMIETLAFAALLRYYAVCEFVKRTSGRRLIALFRNLETIIKQYMSEEKYLLKFVEASLASQAVKHLAFCKGSEDEER